MPPLAAAVIFLGCLPRPVSAGIDAGYLLVRQPSGATHAEPYEPHAGDLVLFDDLKLKWHILYRLVGTEPPDHSGIVVRLPDGRAALLESGPDNGTRVCLTESASRLHQFQGILWVRRLRNPLPAEPCQRLTDFAIAQEGKRYATCRLLLQGTPFRCRGILRKRYFGKTYLDRCSWLCSELVVAAGTAAGLFDPALHPANAIYPRDIIDDETYDLSATWLPAAVWAAQPPKDPTDLARPAN
jgi:hypothetical protein